MSIVMQVELGATEYGCFGTRLLKQITKVFFPRIHAALKPLAEEQCGMRGEDVNHAGGCRRLQHRALDLLSQPALCAYSRLWHNMPRQAVVIAQSYAFVRSNNVWL
jgi:hypothetical protein